MLLQNEYLAAENRILRARLPARLLISDPERSTLAEVAKRLGRKALAQVACVARPDAILAWFRGLIARSSTGPNTAAIAVVHVSGGDVANPDVTVRDVAKMKLVSNELNEMLHAAN